MARPDHELILRAQQGDHEAFGDLVADYQKLVFSVALNMTGNWTDSEDVTQETFLQAWVKLRTVVNPARFASWLYTVTRRTALEYLRRRRNLHFIDIETELNGTDPKWESPAETYARRQLGEILWEEVADLPPRTREALLLFYVENFPIARAAEFLGIHEGAFKMRLKYGREKLQERMLERLEGTLRERHPGERQRYAILALLPGLGLPLPPPVVAPGPAAAPWASRLWSALAAKPVVTISGVVATLVLLGVSFLLRPEGARRDTAETVYREKPESTVITTHTLTGNVPAQNTLVASPPAPTPRTFTIAGHLENMFTTLPAEGAAVKLDQGTKTLTDERGAFRFEGVTAGRHQIKFYGVAKFSEHPTATYLRFPTLDIQVTDRSITDLKVALAPAREFSGTVVDLERRPVAGARIRLSRYENEQEAISGADGRFDIQCFTYSCPPEILTITCEKEGYFKWACDLEEHGDVGRDLKNFAMMMVPTAAGGTISGRLQTPAGQPIANFPVRVHSARPTMNSRGMYTGMPALATLLTDSEGRFKMTSLAPGSYEIATNWWMRIEDQKDCTAACDVTMRGQSEVNLTIEPPTGDGTVSGSVFGADGKPAAGAFICAAPTGAAIGQGMRATLADREGRFRLTGLKPNQAADLFGSISPDGPPAKKLRSAVPVPGGGISLVLTEPVARPIPAPGGSPGANKTRVAQSPPAPPASHVWLESSLAIMGVHNIVGEIESGIPCIMHAGGETMTMLTDGQWTAMRRDAEHTSVPLTVPVYDTRGQRTNTLPLAGRVIDEAGRPVNGAWINSVMSIDPLWRTGADGRFRVWVQPTRFSSPALTVSHPAYAQTTFILPQAQGGQPATDNLTIRLERGGTVRGVIQIGPGRPLAGAEIRLRQEPCPFDRQIITDEQGRFTAEHVTSGTRIFTEFLNPEHLTILRTQQIEKAVQVEEGGMATVNFGVEACHLTGRLTINGRPFSGLTLKFEECPPEPGTREDHPMVSGYTTPGEGGEFEHFAIPWGPCDVVLDLLGKGEYRKRIEIPKSTEARLDIDFKKEDLKQYRSSIIERWATTAEGGVRRTVTRPVP